MFFDEVSDFRRSQHGDKFQGLGLQTSMLSPIEVILGKRMARLTLLRTALGMMMCDRYGLHSCGFLGSKGASVNEHLRPIAFE